MTAWTESYALIERAASPILISRPMDRREIIGGCGWHHGIQTKEAPFRARRKTPQLTLPIHDLSKNSRGMNSLSATPPGGTLWQLAMNALQAGASILATRFWPLIEKRAANSKAQMTTLSENGAQASDACTL